VFGLRARLNSNNQGEVSDKRLALNITDYNPASSPYINTALKINVSHNPSMRLLASTIILVSALVLYLPIVKADSCTDNCSMEYKYVLVHNDRFNDMLNFHYLVRVYLKVNWVSVHSFL
jgi:hypothetical protein